MLRGLNPIALVVCCHRKHHDCHGCSDNIMTVMAVQITIRGVPESVRDELAARAALNRQSMQEYLRCELERMVASPTVNTLLEEVRRRKEAAGTIVPRSLILEARDADRR